MMPGCMPMTTTMADVCDETDLAGMMLYTVPLMLMYVVTMGVMDVLIVMQAVRMCMGLVDVLRAEVPLLVCARRRPALDASARPKGGRRSRG